MRGGTQPGPILLVVHRGDRRAILFAAFPRLSAYRIRVCDSKDMLAGCVPLWLMLQECKLFLFSAFSAHHSADGVPQLTSFPVNALLKGAQPIGSGVGSAVGTG